MNKKDYKTLKSSDGKRSSSISMYDRNPKRQLNSIESITIKNAYSIVEETTFNLTQNKMPNITDNFEDNEIYKDIIIRDKSGTNLITGVIGQNGAGKTNALNAINELGWFLNYHNLLILIRKKIFDQSFHAKDYNKDKRSLNDKKEDILDAIKNEIIDIFNSIKGSSSKEEMLMRIITTDGYTFEVRYFAEQVIISWKKHKTQKEYNLIDVMRNVISPLDLNKYGLMGDFDTKLLTDLHIALDKIWYTQINVSVRFVQYRKEDELLMPRNLLALFGDKALEFINIFDPAINYIGLNDRKLPIVKIGDETMLAADVLPDGIRQILTLTLKTVSFFRLPSDTNLILVDELETHLQPTLISFYLKLFRELTINKYIYQLLFTTHYREIFTNEVSNSNIIILEKKQTKNIFNSSLHEGTLNAFNFDDDGLSGLVDKFDSSRPPVYTTSARRITDVKTLAKQDEREKYFKGAYSYNDFTDKKLGIDLTSFNDAKQTKAIRMIINAINKN